MNSNYKSELWLVYLYRMLMAMLLLGLGRILFHLINLGSFSDMTPMQVLRAYAGGLRFDLAALAYLNMAYSLVALLPLRSRSKPLYEKLSYWLYFVPNAIGFVANVADAMYFPFTLKRSTMSVFSEFANEGPGLYFDLIVQHWYILLLCIVVLTIFYFLSTRSRHTYTRARRRDSRLYYPLHFIVMLSVAALFFVFIRGGIGKSWRPMTLSTANLSVDKLEHRSLVLNTPYSLIRTMGKQALEAKPYFVPKAELRRYFDPIRHFDSVRSKRFASLRGRNVVILIVESFGREFVGLLNKQVAGYKGYTPKFDSIASRGFLFGNAYANGRKSIDAMPSILSSIPSLGLHFINSHYSGNRVEGLPKLLKRHWNYNSCFYHGAPNGSMGFDAYAKQIGFDSYFGKNEYANDADYDGTWGIWDEPFLQRVSEELGMQPRPFLATVFTLSSHNPFKLPKAYEGRFPKGAVPLIQCIGYADHALGRFFEKAAQSAWFENTIFVVTADHASESVLPLYQTPYNRFAVPLLFYAPGADLQGLDMHATVAHCDILPTLLNLLGYEQPVLSFGRDVFDETPAMRSAVNEFEGALQMMTDQHFLQYYASAAVGLYDYRKDPMLKSNLMHTKPELTDSLTKHLRAVEQSYSERMRSNDLCVQEAAER